MKYEYKYLSCWSSNINDVIRKQVEHGFKIHTFTMDVGRQSAHILFERKINIPKKVYDATEAGINRLLAYFDSTEPINGNTLRPFVAYPDLMAKIVRVVLKYPENDNTALLEFDSLVDGKLPQFTDRQMERWSELVDHVRTVNSHLLNQHQEKCGKICATRSEVGSCTLPSDHEGECYDKTSHY